MQVGGYSAEQEVTSDIQELAQAVKEEIQSKCNRAFPTFEVVKFMKQVVAGMNYKLKIKVGEDKYIHAVVFRGLPHTGGALSVTNVEEGKTLEDAL